MIRPPVREILHSLKLTDYLHVQVDKPWYNYYFLWTLGHVWEHQETTRIVGLSYSYSYSSSSFYYYYYYYYHYYYYYYYYYYIFYSPVKNVSCTSWRSLGEGRREPGKYHLPQEERVFLTCTPAEARTHSGERPDVNKLELLGTGP